MGYALREEQFLEILLAVKCLPKGGSHCSTEKPRRKRRSKSACKMRGGSGTSILGSLGITWKCLLLTFLQRLCCPSFVVVLVLPHGSPTTTLPLKGLRWWQSFYSHPVSHKAWGQTMALKQVLLWDKCSGGGRRKTKRDIVGGGLGELLKQHQQY